VVLAITPSSRLQLATIQNHGSIRFFTE